MLWASVSEGSSHDLVIATQDTCPWAHRTNCAPSVWEEKNMGLLFSFFKQPEWCFLKDKSFRCHVLNDCCVGGCVLRCCFSSPPHYRGLHWPTLNQTSRASTNTRLLWLYSCVHGGWKRTMWRGETLMRPLTDEQRHFPVCADPPFSWKTWSTDLEPAFPGWFFIFMSFTMS